MLSVGLALAGSVGAAPVLQQVAPFSAIYVDQAQFDVMTYSPVGDVTAPVQRVGAPGSEGCAPADFAGFPAGYIALMSSGTCSELVKANNATAAGAIGVLIYSSVPGLLDASLTAAYLATYPPVIGLTQALGQELAATPGLRMRMFVDQTPLPPTPPVSVPEPATLVLLALGLLGSTAGLRFASGIGRTAG